MTGFSDVYYRSADGLRLHARDYASEREGIPLLCLPGLTRNARDFTAVAERLAASRRVLVAEQRGRGQSAYDPKPENYQPGIYVQDMVALLDHLAIDRVAIIGTSLGGLMAMMLAAGLPERIAGIFLNDIGPEVALPGLTKIQAYIDRKPNVATWEDAARDLRALFGKSFPNYGPVEWDRFARAVYIEDNRGVPVLDFDPTIAINVKQAEVTAPDLWPLFDALPKIPIAVLRGGLSDILAAETVTEMKARRPDLLAAEIADVGHAPTLDEPAGRLLIDKFLALIPSR